MVLFTYFFRYIAAKKDGQNKHIAHHSDLVSGTCVLPPSNFRSELIFTIFFHVSLFRPMSQLVLLLSDDFKQRLPTYGP